jgi:hypothetical protein
MLSPEYQKAVDEMYTASLNDPLWKELDVKPPTREMFVRETELQLERKNQALENLRRFQRENR